MGETSRIVSVRCTTHQAPMRRRGSLNAWSCPHGKPGNLCVRWLSDELLEAYSPGEDTSAAGFIVEWEGGTGR